MKYYTGIGSRKTPKHILKYMMKIGFSLAKNNYTLRSGGADGADKSFEIGCDMMIDSKKEIYLPWKNFNYSSSDLIVKDKKVFELAKKYHPYWHNLSQGAKKLQARNVHQILGNDLNTLSNFVICYTKDGKGTGGTGQALRIAKDYNIPIFDFGIYDDKDADLTFELRNFLLNVLRKGDYMNEDKEIINEFITYFKQTRLRAPSNLQVNAFAEDFKHIVKMYIKKGYTVKQSIKIVMK